MKKKTFPADLSSLPELLAFAREHLAATSLTPQEQTRLELALEEASVNIMVHGATNPSHTITLTFTLSPTELQIEIWDNCAPFNPLEQEITPDIDSPLEERRAGGLGLPLIHRAADALLYRHDTGHNILTLIKKVGLEGDL